MTFRKCLFRRCDMNLALFDFDGTITTKESISCFLRYLCGSDGAFYVRIMPFIPKILLYLIGLYPNWRIKQDILAVFIKDMPETEFRQKAHKFAQSRIDMILRKEAMDRIMWHREQGDEIVIVSAGIRDYIEPWARSNGIDNVIAVELEVKEGKMTGMLDGLNCYGPEKVRRVKEALDLSKYDKIYAYGDTKGDIEMLNMADIAFYNFRPFNSR